MESCGGPIIMNPELLDIEQIKSMILGKDNNPTVARLIFIETRPTPKNKRKVFPCYPVFVDNAETGKLTISIAQCSMNRYFFGYAKIPVEDIGVKCRFWSLPPTDALMDLNPLEPAVEEEQPEVADPVTDIPKEDPVQ